MKIPIKYASNRRTYDLRIPSDRKELIYEMLIFPPDKILGIKSDMFKQGYTVATDMDVKMYYYLGMDTYKLMGEANFSYSYLEAEYIKMPFTREQFGKLCRLNRSLMWDSAKDILPELLVRGKGIFEFQMQSEEQMKKHIRQKWKVIPNNLEKLLEDKIK